MRKRTIAEASGAGRPVAGTKARRLLSHSSALAAAVKEVSKKNKDSDFPLECLRYARGELGDLVSLASCNDSIGLPQQHAAGKTLGIILQLAGATSRYGFQAITVGRDLYDEDRRAERRAPSRTWTSWVKNDRRNSPWLKDIPTHSWSSIKAVLAAGDTQHEALDDKELAEDVLSCFVAHDAADEIMQWPIPFGCRQCERKCDCWRYHCPFCEVDLCGPCEDRRVNFMD